MANATNVGSIEYDARINTKQFIADAAKVEGSARGLARSLSSKLGGAMTAIASSAKTVSLGILALGTATALLGKSLIQSAAGLQITSQSFKILIGNAKQANKLFGEIKAFADTTPFEFPELAKAATTLLGYGITADQVNDKLKRLGDAAAATGGDLGGITLAYAQMVGRGKVTGDNLRQLTENMVTLRAELSQVSGVPMEKLDKAIEDGEISVDHLNAALELATNKGGKFFGGTAVLAQTLNGRISTLKDGLMEMGRNLLGVKVDPKLGLVIEPGGVFDRLSHFVEDLNKNLPKIQQNIKNVFGFIAKNGKYIALFVGTILTVAFTSWAASVIAATWPILALAAAVAGVVYLFERFRPQIDALWASLQPVRTVIEDIAQLLWEIFMPSLKALWATITTQLIPALGLMFASVMRIWRAIQPAFLTAVKFLAAALGIALVAAIWVLINAANVLAHTWAVVASAVKIAIGWFANTVSWIGNMVVWLARLVQSAVSFSADAIAAFFRFKEAASEVLKGVIAKSVELMGWFKDLPNKIREAIGDAWNVLYDIGKQIIEGLINGIKDKFNDVKNTLGDLTNKMTDWKGPMSLDRVILKKSGQAVIQGFVRGLESQYGMVRSSLGGLTGQLGDSIGNVGLSSINGIDGSASSMGMAAPVSVKVDMSGIMTRSKSDERDIAKSLVGRINEELRAKQLPELGGGNI